MRKMSVPFDAPWMLIDPTLTSELRRSLPAQLLALANEDWQEFGEFDLSIPGSVAFLNRHRVGTMLRPLDVRASERNQHLERLLYINGTQLRIQATAHEALDLLSDISVEAIVLKGLASAELDYPEPGLRQMGDADIAVRLADLEPAVAALEAAGYKTVTASKSGFLLKGVTLRSPTGVEVDIHTRLFQRSPVSDILFAKTEPLQTIPSNALSVNLRLVHAAGHLILAPPGGGRRLSGLIDIAQIRRHPQIDFEVAREHAAHLQVEPLVGAALRLEAQLSGRDDIIESLRTWQTPGWFDQNTRLVAERRLLLDHFCRFREVQRGDRLRYLPAWLVPDKLQRKAFTDSIRRRFSR